MSGVEIHQARDAESRLGRVPLPPKEGSRIAVIYFSRSGNTAIAASHVAHRLGARLFRLEAHDYELGLTGLIAALSDARKHVARVSAPDFDIGEFQTI